MAILPLFIMLFGIGEASKYAIIAVAAAYVVLINTLAGVRNIDPIYLDGNNFHASPLMMFTDIALPGALPMIAGGLKLGMGVALLVIVSAEFVGVGSGIGYLIWTSWQVLQVEKMHVGLIAFAVVGFVTSSAVSALERVFVRGSAPVSAVSGVGQTVDASPEPAASNVAVDMDFQQALSSGLVNL